MMGKLRDLIRDIEGKARELASRMHHMGVYGAAGKNDDSIFLEILKNDNPKGYGRQVIEAQESLLDAQIELSEEIERLKMAEEAYDASRAAIEDAVEVINAAAYAAATTEARDAADAAYAGACRALMVAYEQLISVRAERGRPARRYR